MKKLLLIAALAIVFNMGNAQIKVQLKQGAGYITDTNKISKIPIGDDKITIYAYYDNKGYFDAVYKHSPCFVLYSDIVPTDAYNSYAKNIAKKLNKDMYKNNPYVAEYGKHWGILVATKTIVTGMSKDMVLSALGEPKSQSVTDVGYSVVRVWEYPNKLIYFADGKVSGITEF